MSLTLTDAFRLFVWTAALLTPLSASAQHVFTFSNPTPITVQPLQTVESDMAVTLPQSYITKVRVILHDATFWTAQRLWLVSPTGTAVLLMGEGPGPVVWRSRLQFDDCARRAMVNVIDKSSPLRAGAFRPGLYHPISFAGFPAPPTGAAAPVAQKNPVMSLTALNGRTDAPRAMPNGHWRLVLDYRPQGISATQIGGGWSLVFYTQPDDPLETPWLAPGFVSSESSEAISCARPDYDGDGRTDVAVYRPESAEWFVLESSTHRPRVVSFSAHLAGNPATAVPADYDGDGQTDFAVFDTTTADWIIQSSFSGQVRRIAFGATTFWAVGDTPVPGDYDGDGLDDLAVYRQSTGEWFVRSSSSGAVSRVQWGAPQLGDTPARR